MTNDTSPQLLLGFLNDAWTRASEEANTLRAQLVADQVAALALVKQGSIASVGKNSASQSYTGYGPGKLTQVQIVELIGNLISLYDQIKSKLTAEFQASADFDYTVPADFDFDAPVYDLLNRVLTGQAAGSAPSLPDIRDIRIPLTTEAIATA